MVATNLVDDGAVVYLNGHEIYRLNLPVGPISFTPFASQPVTAVEGAFESALLPATHLLRGDNVLAVEVHQVVSNSSDVVFGLSLKAEFLDRGPLVVIDHPPNQVVPPGSNVVFRVLAAGAEPVSYRWQKGGLPLAEAPRLLGLGTPQLTITNLQPADAGNYSVVLSNLYGSVTSAVAVLTVSESFPLFGFTNVWRFNQSGADLGAAWKEPAFNDAAWNQGPGALGVDNNPAVTPILRTSLALSNAAGSRILTHYFRTRFRFWEEPARFFVTFTNVLDDSAVVYLNGQEVYRLNLPNAPLRANTLALVPAPEPWFVRVDIPGTYLVRGDNVLAVEVHQVTTNSSDVVFGLALEAHPHDRGPATVIRQPQGQCVTVGSNAQFEVLAAGEPPLNYQWRKSGVPLVDDDRVQGVSTSHLSIANVNPGDLGDYSVVVQNAAGSSTSSPASLWFPPPPFRWVQAAGGTSTEDTHDIAVDPSGNVYVTGSFQGTASWGTTNVTSRGAQDVYLAKYSRTGRFLWVQTAGGTGNDFGGGVAVDLQGNCYLAGHFSGTATFIPGSVGSAGRYDVFVGKYSPDGRLLWIRSSGGSQDDFCWSVAVDLSGACYFTGNFSGTALFGLQSLTSAGSPDIYLASYDTDGNFRWAARSGGSGSDHGAQVAVDSQGAPHLTGWFGGSANFSGRTLSSSGSSDAFVAKYTTTGALVWAQRVGDVRGDVGKSIDVDTNGNAYLLAVFDANELGQPTRLIVNQYDSNGTLAWSRQAYSAFYSSLCRLAADDRGCYVTGGFRHTATFGQATLISAGDQDVFVASYNSDGALRWVQVAGGPTPEFAAGVIAGPRHDIYLAGWFTSTAGFGTNVVTSRGSQDVFVASLGEVLDPAAVRFGPLIFRSANTELHLRLGGLAGATAVVLESSTNLSLWKPVLTNSLPLDPLEIKVTPANAAQHFYRALILE